MRSLSRVSLFVVFLFFVLGVSVVSARDAQQAGADDVTIGGQLYDRWYAVLGVPAPDGNMPVWERQSTNTRSGVDTWRCSECHGWDYKGSEGAYGSGSHFTGFPNVIKLAGEMSEDEIVAHLNGSNDPSHDFSMYIDEANMRKLAAFLKEGVIDDAAFIDPVTLKVINGNPAHGKQLYAQTCVPCHGNDGKTIVFRTEGVNEYLGSVANRDPYRFLHRTRFGVAGTEMPVGRNLGWTPSDGRDVLAYVQTFSADIAPEMVVDAGADSESSSDVGGPKGLAGGVLTGLAAFFGMLGMSTLFFVVLLVLGLVVIFAVRRRK